MQISLGSVDYLPRPVPDADLAIMRRLDQLHLEFPFAGSRMLRGLLAAEGCKIGRRHVKTLMQRMGIEGAVPAPAYLPAGARPQDLSVSAARNGVHTAKPSLGDGHHQHSNGAWVRLPRRCARLGDPPGTVMAAVGHHGSRFCVETLQHALACHGKPRNLTSTRARSSTGQAFTGLLADHDIAISMDGKGAWRDNVFVERLWRSIKYEEVYLRAYGSVGEARKSIGQCLDFYDGRRPLSSLDGQTPDQADFNSLPIRMAA